MVRNTLQGVAFLRHNILSIRETKAKSIHYTFNLYEFSDNAQASNHYNWIFSA